MIPSDKTRRLNRGLGLLLALSTLRET